MIVDVAFAVGAVDDAVDGKAIVGVFVEKQIAPTAVGVRPSFTALPHRLVFDQCFKQVAAFFRARFGIGSAAQAVRNSSMNLANSWSLSLSP